MCFHRACEALDQPGKLACLRKGQFAVSNSLSDGARSLLACSVYGVVLCARVFWQYAKMPETPAWMVGRVIPCAILTPILVLNIVFICELKSDEVEPSRARLDQVVAATTDYGSFSIITLDANTAIWLIGVTPGQLNAGDFVF